MNQTVLIMKENPLVATVVLNYREPDATVRCVESVLSSSLSNLLVIVVDNSSDPTLRDRILSMRDTLYMDSGQNLGYAGGNNVGIQKALSMGAEFIFVLNNDTIVDQNALRALTSAYQASKNNIGAIYPRVYHTRFPERNPSAGGRIRCDGTTYHVLDSGNLPLDNEGLYGQLDWLPGAALFFPRQVLIDVGFFNPGYFIYFEDVEWSLRARRKGYSLKYCPSAIVFHEGEKAIRKTTSEVRTYYPLRNHLSTAKNWMPRFSFLLLAIRKIGVEFPLAILLNIAHRRTKMIRIWATAILDGLTDKLEWRYV